MSTEQTEAAPDCARDGLNHHWVSHMGDGMPIYVVQCSQCGRYNARDMQNQIDQITVKATEALLRQLWEANDRINFLEHEGPYKND